LYQLHDPREFVHRIDNDGRLQFVNDAWLAFAAENGWRISAKEVVGSDLMEHITDLETRHIYGLLIDRAWRQGRRARFNYRCDSPDCRRFMEMRINHDSTLDQVVFRSRVLHMERRAPVDLMNPLHDTRSDEILRVCGWCKAVRVEDAWLEVELAVEKLGILSEQVLPQISHGICPGCSKRMASV
jgi:hypothetical protein